MATILIIGGGVAGLSAGIYGQLHGHRTIICEQHSIPGGNLTGWNRDGYHIDNCIHWLTGTNPATDTYRMWNELGALGNTEVYQPETLYTCEYDGRRLSLHKDLTQLKLTMLHTAPEDTAEIKAFIHAVSSMQRFLHIGGRHHNETCTPVEKLTLLPELYRYHRLSTSQLADRFHHPLLQRFFTSVLGSHFSALALILICATFCGENGGIPIGGSHAMAQRMAERFRQLGGTLYCDRKAVQIHCRCRKATAVTFADGSVLEADYLILAADPSALFYKVLPAPMPPALAKQYCQPELQQFSAFHCAFACDTKTPPFRGDLILELPQHCRNLLHSKTMLLREFSHEAAFAPAGKTLLQTLVFCDTQTAGTCIRSQLDTEQYERRKQQLGILMQRCIVERFPALSGKLRCIDVWTPATYRRFTGAETGAFMSFTLPPKLLPRHLSNRVPPFQNVILATQWLQSPGGLPIAAGEGRRAIRTITGLEQQK